ncbi:hypothetical protein J7426_14385 [Tropicibacter sp. R16_0]|uniref:hypothetical protein n=1 Tax=Tropicibacter sp. R16_0 TaxID=2821102 RepID=UPI001AD95DDF|nr:hypothetical protein [Tropicibacter sp. R16_0]MBO9451458.1 hypothetical protein [Tropicibacter sp. R16_0]
MHNDLLPIAPGLWFPATIPQGCRILSLCSATVPVGVNISRKKSWLAVPHPIRRTPRASQLSNPNRHLATAVPDRKPRNKGRDLIRVWMAARSPATVNPTAKPFMFDNRSGGRCVAKAMGPHTVLWKLQLGFLSLKRPLDQPPYIDLDLPSCMHRTPPHRGLT